MTSVALIPARGGSKGISRKNIKPFNSKPLIYWSIKAALRSNYIDRVIVSTEDKEIAEIARMLINAAADVNYQDDLSRTSLMDASRNGQTELEEI